MKRETMPPPLPAVTGAAMDRPMLRRHRYRFAKPAAGVLLLVLIGFGFWMALPRGLPVALADVRIAAVERGMFLDNIVVRANAQAQTSVILDAVESGRVEEVFARDGALVQRGQLLFRLSNAQRNIELLAREAEQAQQISNLSNLRVAQEASRNDHQRRMSDLEFTLAQSEKQHARNTRLAAQGFISGVALEESNDRVQQQRHAVEQEKAGAEIEGRVRADAMTQMEAAIKGLQSGLQLVNGTVAALAVRAPIDGRLTDFHLQVGQAVKTDEHIGRIDDPHNVKLVAQVDEYYLGRIALGLQGVVRLAERDYAVKLSAIYPQIKDGRFSVELLFAGDGPALNPGQSVDAQITLGEPAPALLLPNGEFANDSGGAWAYVLTPNGATAQRRLIKLGRRSNSQLEVLSGLAQGEKVIVSGYAAFGKSERLQLSK